MPPDTNRGAAVAGGWVRLGSRKLTNGSCREEVAAVIGFLAARTGQQVFTVPEVYEAMVAAGTRFAESTVFKTMQRMKAPPVRPPFLRLERANGDGFRLALGLEGLQERKANSG